MPTRRYVCLYWRLHYRWRISSRTSQPPLKKEMHREGDGVEIITKGSPKGLEAQLCWQNMPEVWSCQRVWNREYLHNWLWCDVKVSVAGDISMMRENVGWMTKTITGLENSTFSLRWNSFTLITIESQQKGFQLFYTIIQVACLAILSRGGAELDMTLFMTLPGVPLRNSSVFALWFGLRVLRCCSTVFQTVLRQRPKGRSVLRVWILNPLLLVRRFLGSEIFLGVNMHFVFVVPVGSCRLFYRA